MLTSLARGVAAVGLFALPGFCWTYFLPALRRMSLALRAAYGYLFGLTWIAGMLYGLSHLFAVPLRPPAVLLLAAVPMVAAFARLAVHLQRRPSPAAAPPGLRRAVAGWRHWRQRPLQAVIAGVALAVAGVVCAAVFAEAVSDPVNDWDGRMTWGAQARFIEAAGSVDAPVLRQAQWFVTHPQYPLLLPLAQVAVREVFTGDPDAPLPRVLYAAFLAALLALLYDGARRAGGPAAAAVTVLCLAVTPYLLLGAGGATTTYNDLPLAAFFGGGLLLLLGPRPTLDRAVAGGILLAGAVLIKNEGLILALVALALSWRKGLPRDRTGSQRADEQAASRRRLLLAAAPVLVAMAFLAAWRGGIVNRQDDAYGALLRTADLAAILERPALFFPTMVHTMLDVNLWARFWWMVAAVLIAGHRTFRHPRQRRFLVAAVAPLAVAWAAYTVHPQPAELAALTWNRILLQSAVPLLVLVAGALREAWWPFLRGLRRVRSTTQQAIVPRPEDLSQR